MELDTIYNEDCLVTMGSHIDANSVDIVLTSPPYCTSNRAGKKSTATLTNTYTSGYPSYRYDVFLDNMSPDEYIEWTVKLFNGFDRILKKDGCVLYNVSYSSSNRDTMFLAVAEVVGKTNFSIADWIGWKKRSALPNNTSPNKLTRIFEPVFVFARKEEMGTFFCNKKAVSVRERTGQKMYENVFNFIEAANNDGACKLNKATYSSELCEKLLGIYGCGGMTVYDPFMGTGTTAVACKRLGMNYVGSEISPAQIEFAKERIANDSIVRNGANAEDKDGGGENVGAEDAPCVQTELFNNSERRLWYTVASICRRCRFVNATRIAENVVVKEEVTTERAVAEMDSDCGFETMCSSSVGFSSNAVATPSMSDSDWETV